jgi:hypothetical protein
MCRACERFPEPIRHHIQSAEVRLRTLAADALRYVSLLRRRPDPARELIRIHTEEHLRLLHQTTQQFLPRGANPSAPLDAAEIRKLILQRSERHDSTTE